MKKQSQSIQSNKISKPLSKDGMERLAGSVIDQNVKKGAFVETNLKPGDSDVLSSKLGEEIAAVVIDDIISSQSSNKSLLRPLIVRSRDKVIPSLAGQTLSVRSREVYTRAIVGK
ncbi:MAG: hypothetical protein Q8P92_01085 [Candidatus Daviesbacteria bacterium]|nr:hypothetical protein [Candidatus Daviesbacteria bacterium]